MFYFLGGKKGGKRKRRKRKERKKNVHGQAASDVCRNWEIVFCDPPTSCFNEEDLTLVLHTRVQSEEQRCKVCTARRGVGVDKATNWRPFVWPTAPERTVCSAAFLYLFSPSLHRGSRERLQCFHSLKGRRVFTHTHMHTHIYSLFFFPSLTPLTFSLRRRHIPPGCKHTVHA